MKDDGYWDGFVPWGCLIIAIQLALFGCATWVVVHFIRKYW